MWLEHENKSRLFAWSAFTIGSMRAEYFEMMKTQMMKTVEVAALCNWNASDLVLLLPSFDSVFKPATIVS